MRIENASLALVQSVVGHYLAVLRAQDQEKVVEQEVDRAVEDLRLAQVRNELGAAADWEVQRAQVTQGRAEINLLQARNQLRTARLRFAQQLGLPPEEEFDLTSRFELFEPTWEEEELYQLALQASPELASFRAEEDASRHGVRIARSRYLPSFWLDAFVSGFTRRTRDEDRLIFEAENAVNNSLQNCLNTNEIYSRLAQPLPLQDCSVLQFTDANRQSILKANRAFPFGFITTPPLLTLGVSFPIFQGMSRKRDVAVAQAQADDARYRREERVLGLRADVSAGLGMVETAYRSALLEEVNQDVARQQLRLARERYEMGSGSFLELVEAETVMASSERALLDSVYGFHQAVVDLESLIGTTLRGR
jgi:outer membrane protein